MPACTTTTTTTTTTTLTTTSQEERMIITRASKELEEIRCVPSYSGVTFPPSCLHLLHALPGNAFCVDCGAPGPDWASVTYGCLMCLQCSGRHRSYGVKTSFVRSILMDVWSHGQILAMLEGGNDQLTNFFNRHQMSTTSSVNTKRYLTKAAKFYRIHLAKHVDEVSAAGMYQGREAARRKHQKQQQPQQQQHQQQHADDVYQPLKRQAPPQQEGQARTLSRQLPNRLTTHSMKPTHHSAAPSTATLLDAKKTAATASNSSSCLEVAVDQGRISQCRVAAQ